MCKTISIIVLLLFSAFVALFLFDSYNSRRFFDAREDVRRVSYVIKEYIKIQGEFPDNLEDLKEEGLIKKDNHSTGQEYLIINCFNQWEEVDIEGYIIAFGINYNDLAISNGTIVSRDTGQPVHLILPPENRAETVHGDAERLSMEIYETMKQCQNKTASQADAAIQNNDADL